MGRIMISEEGRYSIEHCHKCEYGELIKTTGENDEVTMRVECKIKDIKKCPIVIHDMSL